MPPKRPTTIIQESSNLSDNATKIIWNGSTLALATFLQNSRTLVLQQNAKFSTLIEKGFVLEKGRTITRSALHALMIKSRLCTAGSWETVIVSPTPPAAFAQWLHDHAYITDEQLVALIATNQAQAGAAPTYQFDTLEVALTHEDNQRFTVSPETIEELDRAFCTAQTSHMDRATGMQYENAANGSGLQLLYNLNHLRTRSNRSVGCAAEQTLSHMRENGITDISAQGFNEWSQQYTLWNNAQPEGKLRSNDLLIDDFTEAVRKLGDNVSLKYDIACIHYQHEFNRHPRDSLDDTSQCIRTMLDSMDTDSLTAQMGKGHAFAATGRKRVDPPKNRRDVPQGSP